MEKVGLRVALGLVMLVALAASPARADVVYYSNLNHVSFAPLAGADGGDLNTSGGVLSEAEGTALDPAHGRIYWDDARSGTISFANLDGSGGGGTVNTAGATITESFGLAIDPIARRVYWANCEADNYVIAYADLDGGGGHNLATPGASVACPEAVAVDPSAGLIYWINDEGSARGVVSYAHLDGSGGKDIVRLGGIPPSGPAHLLTVAVDPVNRRVWWTNAYTSTLGSSNLDGSGQSTLPIAPNIATPVGVALDPGAGRVYWANHDSNSKTLAFAGFDGSGAGGIARGLATMNSPSFPVVLKPPLAAAPPVVTRRSSSGSTLACSTGDWAPDLPPAFLYQAPTRFVYKWRRNGATIHGATASTIRAKAAGSYRCAVTASNQAGAASQTSRALAVSGGSLCRGGKGSASSSRKPRCGSRHG